MADPPVTRRTRKRRQGDRVEDEDGADSAAGEVERADGTHVSLHPSPAKRARRDESRRVVDVLEARPPKLPPAPETSTALTTARDETGYPVMMTLSELKVHRAHEARRESKISAAGGTIEPNLQWDDADGHYVISLGADLTRRYKILRKMGEGTFARVCECWDRKERERVAIKIIRNVPKYHDAAIIELDVLKTLRRHDAEDTNGVVHLQSFFLYRDHICMVFKKLGLSLFDFLRKNHYQQFRWNDVLRFTYQIIRSVKYIHSLGLIHTDLKPENILFVNSEYYKIPGKKMSYRVPKQTDLKIIDFGSATFSEEYHARVVSTRHYRAPEIILGLGWSYPCDMWSIGCILVELYTGDAVFQTHDNVEHLAMMEKFLGPIPRRLTDGITNDTREIFDSRGALRWPELSTETSRKHVNRLPSMRSLFEGEERHAHFYDLCRQLLVYDPAERITADEALEHDLFTSLVV